MNDSVLRKIQHPKRMFYKRPNGATNVHQQEAHNWLNSINVGTQLPLRFLILVEVRFSVEHH